MPPSGKRPNGSSGSSGSSGLAGSATVAGRGDRWVRRFARFARPHWLQLTGAVAAATVAGFTASIGPIVQRIIVDDVIVAGTRQLDVWLGVLVAVGLVSAGATAVRRYLGNRFSLGVQHDVRLAVFDHLVHLDRRSRDDYPAGDLFSRATADVSLVNQVLGRLHNVVGNVVQLATALVAMLILSPLLAALVVGCTPVFAFTSNRMRRRLFPAMWHGQRELAHTTSMVGESVAGVRVVKAYGRTAGEVDRYAAASRDLFRSRLRIIRLDAFYAATLQALPGLAQVLVVVAGGLLAINGRVSLGTFVAFASYVGQMLGPVRSLSRYFADSQQARAGAERILSFLDVESTIADPVDPVDLPPGDGALHVDDVTFGYEPGRPVLDGLSLHVAAGERVAVVGRSGSGKSTLARLLVRDHDVEGGTIRLDDVAIDDLRLRDLRRAVGGVVGEPFVFSASVGDNIAFGAGVVSDEQVAAAAAVAGAAEFVDRLPEGYRTQVGERGLTLSGGQRQRLVLARAVLGDRRVLVLDDATSAVDGQTEQAIHGRLRDATGDRTTILVGHRRSTLRLADRLVVLDGGRVVDEGTIDELLERSPVFRSVWGGAPDRDDDARPDSDDDARPGRAAARAASTGPGAVVASIGADPSFGAGEPARHGDADRLPRGSGRRTLAAAVATPELIDAVERLPPLSGEPDVALVGTDPGTGHGLRASVGPFKRPLAGGLALVALSSILALVGPLALRHAVDSGIGAASAGVVLAAAGVMLATVAVGWVVAMVTSGHTGRTAERMLFVQRVRAFAHLQALPIPYFESRTTGRIIALLTADVEALGALLRQGIIGTAVSSASALGAAAILVALDWRLALSAATVLVPLAVLTGRFGRRSRRAHAEARRALSAMYSELGEGIAAVDASQLAADEPAAVQRLADRSARHMRARLHSVRASASYFPAVQYLSEVASAIVLGVGAVMVERGTSTIGLLLAFLVYVELFFRPLRELSEQVDLWAAARVSMANLRDLMDEAPEDTAGGKSRPHVVPDSLGLARVTLAYPGGAAPALADVSLEIGRGETVAVVGATGAGKSTLAKLLTGFYPPTSGVVTVGGRRLDELDLVAHRRRIGYVQQEPVLFARSVRDNIAYGRPDASDSDVEDAARSVGVHDTIAGLPDGYATVLGPHAMSAGERQLVCLARALLVDPALLVLDEATASLDLAAEDQVRRAMETVSSTRTTVVIAHRLQTVTAADRIVVLDRGRIVESGTHDGLIVASGPYAAMWEVFAEADDALAS